MRRLRLHGAFRSGTNYVKALLELNCDVELIGVRRGWKHAPIAAPRERNAIPIIGVVRDPHVWVVSFWRFIEAGGRRHVECGDSWRTFLIEPITITHADREWPVFRFSSPAEYWNAMTASMLSAATVVRYEDARANPLDTCRIIGDLLGLDVAETFTPVKMRTRNMVDRNRSQMSEYVTDEPYRLTDERTSSWAFRRRLDQELVSYFY